MFDFLFGVCSVVGLAVLMYLGIYTVYWTGRIMSWPELYRRVHEGTLTTREAIEMLRETDR